jgi:hypothetical protein
MVEVVAQAADRVVPAVLAGAVQLDQELDPQRQPAWLQHRHQPPLAHLEAEVLGQDALQLGEVAGQVGGGEPGQGGAALLDPAGHLQHQRHAQPEAVHVQERPQPGRPEPLDQHLAHPGPSGSSCR